MKAAAMTIPWRNDGFHEPVLVSGAIKCIFMLYQANPLFQVQSGFMFQSPLGNATNTPTAVHVQSIGAVKTTNSNQQDAYRARRTARVPA